MTTTRSELASTFIPFLAVCEVIGIHYNTGYLLRREGRFPVPVVTIGGRYFCRRTEVEQFTGQALVS